MQILELVLKMWTHTKNGRHVLTTTDQRSELATCFQSLNHFMVKFGHRGLRCGLELSLSKRQWGQIFFNTRKLTKSLCVRPICSAHSLRWKLLNQKGGLYVCPIVPLPCKVHYTQACRVLWLRLRINHASNICSESKSLGLTKSWQFQTPFEPHWKS